MRNRDLGVFLASVAVPEAVGGLGGLATAAGVKSWYPQLRKPGFTPPSWVFGPVWTLLYFLMGCGLYLAWKAPRTRRRGPALIAFAIQLALNGLWSVLFFGFRRTGWALLELALLWTAILWMIVSLRRISPLAAGLQVPYLAWVTYAGALNAALWRLNSSSGSRPGDSSGSGR